MREKTKLKRKHIKMTEEFKATLGKVKKNRIEIIKNEAFELLSNVTKKKVDLRNEVKILILELEELELPKKLIHETIEDILFDPYYVYY